MNNYDTILWILGTIISIALSYWGIWYSKKTQRSPKLSLVESKTIYLLNTLHEKFSTLTVEYGGKPIDNNLVYYEAYLINDGEVDIDKHRFHGPVEISLPENYVLIESRITKQSNQNIDASIVIENSKISIKWNLLKSNEFIQLECIIVAPLKNTKKKITELVNINGRITDLKIIQKIIVDIDLWRRSLTKNFFRRNSEGIFVLILVAVLSLMITWSIKTEDNKLTGGHYTRYNGSKNVEVEIKYLNNDMLGIYEDNKLVDSIARQNISNEIKLVVPPQSPDSRYKYLQLLFPFILLIINVFAIYRDEKSIRKKKRLFKLINPTP